MDDELDRNQPMEWTWEVPIDNPGPYRFKVQWSGHPNARPHFSWTELDGREIQCQRRGCSNFVESSYSFCTDCLEKYPPFKEFGRELLPGSQVRRSDE